MSLSKAQIDICSLVEIAQKIGYYNREMELVIQGKSKTSKSFLDDKLKYHNIRYEEIYDKWLR